MAEAAPRRYMPTLAMAAEILEDQGWPCHLVVPEPDRIYLGARLYAGQKDLSPDILYLLTEETAGIFPVDRYSFVSVVSVSGAANHILCPGRDAAAVMALLAELFNRFREQEAAMDRLVMASGSLDELCQLGQELGGCPVCIHDDWFIIIANKRLRFQSTIFIKFFLYSVLSSNKFSRFAILIIVFFSNCRSLNIIFINNYRLSI